jgi:hypothetical protein
MYAASTIRIGGSDRRARCRSLTARRTAWRVAREPRARYTTISEADKVLAAKGGVVEHQVGPQG